MIKLFVIYVVLVVGGVALLPELTLKQTFGALFMFWGGIAWQLFWEKLTGVKRR